VNIESYLCSSHSTVISLSLHCVLLHRLCFAVQITTVCHFGRHRHASPSLLYAVCLASVCNFTITITLTITDSNSNSNSCVKLIVMSDALQSVFSCSRIVLLYCVVKINCLQTKPKVFISLYIALLFVTHYLLTCIYSRNPTVPLSEIFEGFD